MNFDEWYSCYMFNYIKEVWIILSISALICFFPVFVPAQDSHLDKIIENKISKMSLSEKAGQLFIIGFPYRSIDSNFMSFLNQYKPGSFIIFKRNIESLEQIRSLNTSLYLASYKYSNLPPLIAIDQEGGSVSRLPIEPAQPNSLALGQTQSSLFAEEMGYEIGSFLREVGFNMNLAPVLDISDPLMPSFIGPRSFGSNPNVVKELGVAYSQGLIKARVLPTAKHFPGTGSLSADPHESIVKNFATEKKIKNRDLIPFKAFADLGEHSAMMLSHSIFPKIDPSGEPASFSSKIVQEMLRTELRYNGLIITDDLQMKGSKQLLRPEFAALKSLKAGADIVMMSWSTNDQKKAILTVMNAIENNEIPTEQLDAKLKRILKVKAFTNRYKKDPHQLRLSQGGKLTSPAYANLEGKIFSTNFAFNMMPKSLPLKETVIRSVASQNKVCAFSTSKDFLEGFKNQNIVSTEIFQIESTSTQDTLREWIKNEGCDRLLLTVNGPVSARLSRTFSSEMRRNLVIINLASPNFIKDESSYKKVIHLYFNHKNSGQKIAEKLNEIFS